MKAMPGRDALRTMIDARLSKVIDPCSVGAGNPMNIVEMGLIKAVEIHAGAVEIELCLTSPTCMMLEHFVNEARRLIVDLPGVTSVNVRGDRGLDWIPERMHHQAHVKRRVHLALLQSRSDAMLPDGQPA